MHGYGRSRDLLSKYIYMVEKSFLRMFEWFLAQNLYRRGSCDSGRSLFLYGFSINGIWEAVLVHLQNAHWLYWQLILLVLVLVDYFSKFPFPFQAELSKVHNHSSLHLMVTWFEAWLVCDVNQPIHGTNLLSYALDSSFRSSCIGKSQPKNTHTSLNMDPSWLTRISMRHNIVLGNSFNGWCNQVHVH